MKIWLKITILLLGAAFLNLQLACMPMSDRGSTVAGDVRVYRTDPSNIYLDVYLFVMEPVYRPVEDGKRLEVAAMALQKLENIQSFEELDCRFVRFVLTNLDSDHAKRNGSAHMASIIVSKTELATNQSGLGSFFTRVGQRIERNPRRIGTSLRDSDQVKEHEAKIAGNTAVRDPF